MPAALALRPRIVAHGATHGATVYGPSAQKTSAVYPPPLTYSVPVSFPRYPNSLIHFWRTCAGVNDSQQNKMCHHFLPSFPLPISGQVVADPYKGGSIFAVQGRLAQLTLKYATSPPFSPPWAGRRRPPYKGGSIFGYLHH